MKRLRLVLLLTTALLATGVLAFVLLLRHPSWLFPHSVRRGNLSLYSDVPFQPEAGLRVLERVQAKLDRSDLYTRGRTDEAFVCNTTWRRLLFFSANRAARGLNYTPVSEKLFLRDVVIESDGLASSSTPKIEEDRTLSFFITHELAHTLTLEQVGAIAYWRAPMWLREAFADRVARGSLFRDSASRAAYLDNAPEMNWPPIAPYRRYNLLLGQLLENEHLSVREVFEQRITQEDAEKRLRRFLGRQQ